MPKPTQEPPDTVDDDHFTWWHDEQNFTNMSPYEIAAMAWHEAVARMLEAGR